MNCPKCHSPALPGSIYCPSCGTRLAENAEPRPTDSAQIRIGRSEDNDIQLTDSLVSRYHAALFRQQNGEWRLEDLSSKNGTFVNGRRVDSAILSPSDEIVMGGVRASLAELLAQSGPRGRRASESAPRARAPYHASASVPDATPTAVKCIVLIPVVLNIAGIFFSISVIHFVYSVGSLLASILISFLFCWLYYKLYTLQNWARIFFIIWDSIKIFFSSLTIILALDHCYGSDAEIAILIFFFALLYFIYAVVAVYYLTRPNIVAVFR